MLRSGTLRNNRLSFLLVVLGTIILLGVYIWMTGLLEDDGGEDTMADPEVVSLLKERFLVPPPALDEPSGLNSLSKHDRTAAQTTIIRNILNNMRDGFFIECGAYDGEHMSNTLHLEMVYNWTGLLIEASPNTYRHLAEKKRKAYLSPTCLSRKKHPELITFVDQDVGGHIMQRKREKNAITDFEVQCFPLYSYLLALNRTTVDYISLDVESNELDVLKTIPWDKVDIRTLSVEYFLVRQGKRALRRYMEAQGYVVHSEIKIGTIHLADDYIFVKKSILGL